MHKPVVYLVKKEVRNHTVLLSCHNTLEKAKEYAITAVKKYNADAPVYDKLYQEGIIYSKHKVMAWSDEDFAVTIYIKVKRLKDET